MKFDPLIYDKWYDENWETFMQEARILQEAGIENPAAEIGAGTGRFNEALKIDVAVDISREMLKLARNRAREIVVGSACSLPFRDRSFRFTVFAFSLSFIGCKAVAISEARRISEFTVVLDFAKEDEYFAELKAQYGDIKPFNPYEINPEGLLFIKHFKLNLMGKEVSLQLIKWKN